MDSSLACKALGAKRRLEVRYDGFSRVVEVHAVGTSTAGNAVMRVYQVRGGSVSGEKIGWKLMRLDEAVGGSILDEVSDAPRPGYSPGDKAMRDIVCQL